MILTQGPTNWEESGVKDDGIICVWATRHFKHRTDFKLSLITSFKTSPWPRYLRRSPPDLQLWSSLSCRASAQQTQRIKISLSWKKSKVGGLNCFYLYKVFP